MEIDYKTFAEEVSFFEFLESEFGKQLFPREMYKEELRQVNNIKSINDVVKLLEEYPKIFDLYEGYFQLSTFTVAQYTHFLFDVYKLNYSDDKILESYFNNSCINYENGLKNEKFKFYYDKYAEKPFDKYALKRGITDYVYYAQKGKLGSRGREMLYNHIRNNVSTRIRIADYLVTSRELLEHSAQKSIEKVLTLKRKPVDPKGYSGRYGTYRIEKILKNNGFNELDESIKRKFNVDDRLNMKGLHYAREANVYNTNGTIPFYKKKFDFVLFKDGQPFFLIETNFYSTSGTKIGINKGEYIKLSRSIKEFSAKNGNRLFFSWITDGNYWLSSQGKNTWEEIRESMEGDYEMLNYSLLEKCIGQIVNLI